MAMSPAEKMKRYRERLRGVTVTDKAESVTENVTPKRSEGCWHKPIVAHEGARVLTYTAKGQPLGDEQLAGLMRGLPEARMVRCPCCGWEWECKRPDVQTETCLRCERN